MGALWGKRKFYSVLFQFNLFRNITRDLLCPICELEPETLGHILWSCGSARDVWLESCWKLQKSSICDEAFAGVFEQLSAYLDPEELQFFVTVARQIWLRRNAFVFGRPLLAPAEVIRRAKEQISAFEKTEAGRCKPQVPLRNHAAHTWQKPPEGFVKLNWDASIDARRQRIGIGVAVRNSNSTLLALLCASKTMLTDPGTAEALAAWHAAEITRRLGLRQVVLEEDALEVINVLKMDEGWLGSYGQVIQDAKTLLGHCLEWRVRHTLREGNN
ncbi:uncharacterized protein LOC132163035 [Corylus avellana]|uniref:uncharacterized protein LOC132163035 n=1 Tax=Corylus avellana TaxID=13451 RepID=UPI00286B9B8E|nr:uncharacterized protein LOC132163035 [Corylus avellana]